jgi:hypothetical protein
MKWIVLLAPLCAAPSLAQQASPPVGSSAAERPFIMDAPPEGVRPPDFQAETLVYSDLIGRRAPPPPSLTCQRDGKEIPCQPVLPPSEGAPNATYGVPQLYRTQPSGT